MRAPADRTRLPLFRSFWIGGFEGADHVNGLGIPLDPNLSNGHALRMDEDYAALAEFDIRTVRETIGWRLIESRGIEGLRQLEAQARSASRHGIQTIWTLMHYGWPVGLDPFARPEGFSSTPSPRIAVGWPRCLSESAGRARSTSRSTRSPFFRGPRPVPA